MLLDKGYYDYDYEVPKFMKGKNISKSTNPDKLKNKLERLGFAVKPKKPLTPSELQAEMMKYEKGK